MQKLLKIYQHQLELIEYEIEKQKVDAKIGIVLDKGLQVANLQVCLMFRT